MIHRCSIRTQGPRPTRSRLKVWNCDLLASKQGYSTTLVPVRFCQVIWMKLRSHPWTYFGTPLHQGLGYRIKTWLKTFPLSSKILVLNFMEFRLAVWISVGNIQTHTNTHTLTHTLMHTLSFIYRKQYQTSFNISIWRF